MIKTLNRKYAFKVKCVDLGTNLIKADDALKTQRKYFEPETPRFSSDHCDRLNDKSP